MVDLLAQAATLRPRRFKNRLQRTLAAGANARRDACSSSFARSVRVHQWTWPLRLRRKIRSVSNTENKFHPCCDTLFDEKGQVQKYQHIEERVRSRRTPLLVQKYQRIKETARSKQTPSLVQKYQLHASECQDAKVADRRTEHGEKNYKLAALPLCACVSLVYCSLAVVPLTCVVRLPVSSG